MGPDGQFSRGERFERFTAVTTGLMVALLPVLALRGDSPIEPADQSAQAAPELPPGVAADGKLPVDDRMSPEFLEEVSTEPDLSAHAEPADQVPPGPLGIPAPVLAAYQRAERTLARTDPGCGLRWTVLAGIGRIESNHARSGRVDVNGRTLSPILGPQLSGGPGMATIRDTDGGRLDGDRTWDRAVGPMQFIPSTWRNHAADGNGDGVSDPHNVFDATLASGQYLCSGNGNLRDRAQLAAAVFRYNHSESYVRSVLTWADAYARGAMPTPSDTSIPGDPTLLAFAPPPPGVAPVPAAGAMAAPPPGAAPPPAAASPAAAAPAPAAAPPPGGAPPPPPPGATTPPPPPPVTTTLSPPPPSSEPPPPPSSSEPPPSSEPPLSSEPPPPASSAPPPSSSQPPPSGASTSSPST
ncbi:lytic transglycosylase domain-containing protein [Saccharopolyspora spinosa]|uniref:lytic transglycosylase domain-containing protein n=1 Tax=Saccharopolyspora spinosa TaxID=60894 RepID=UPI000237899A|nr:lytic murein transglycosylase [Saccharopolyspora spinosa]